MHIKIYGNDFSGYLCKEIQFLTGRASFITNSINKALDERKVEFIIKRQPVDSYKIGYFGNIRVKYQKNKSVYTKITVNSITANVFDIPNSSEYSEVMILFGIVIESNSITIASAQEKQDGSALLSLTMKYSILDIEFQDCEYNSC